MAYGKSRLLKNDAFRNDQAPRLHLGESATARVEENDGSNAPASEAVGSTNLPGDQDPPGQFTECLACDVFVVDERGKLRRPYLTLCVDAWSRMVVGFQTHFPSDEVPDEAYSDQGARP